MFTLPAPIAAIAFQNKAAVYAILFKAAAEAMTTLAANPRRLGAEIGVVAVLHTWGQTLTHHPHVHCVVPGGGLSLDGTRWVAGRPNFFLAVKPLSRLFRRLFLERLQAAFDAGASASSAISRIWPIPPPSPPIWPPRGASIGSSTPRSRSADPRRSSPISAATRIASPSPTAASQACDDDHVAFTWKDYRHDGAAKIMRLKPDEFIRRFLLHALPDGFHRIRHFGFLANGHRPKSSPSVARC